MLHVILQACDSQSTGKVLKAFVQMCFDLQEWELLNEHIQLLTNSSCAFICCLCIYIKYYIGRVNICMYLILYFGFSYQAVASMVEQCCGADSRLRDQI